MTQAITQAHHVARRNRIKFLASGVRAIELGLKTQTRRPIKPQPDEDGLSKVITTGEWHDTSCMVYVPPYGEKDHCLKVCEPWQQSTQNGKNQIIYEATSPGVAGPWCSPDTMPSEASRLTLIVTSVRAERLQVITEADARAEGITDGGCLSCGNPEPCGCDDLRPDARDAFAWLWQSIHGPDGWHANPCVWAITFRRLQP